MFFARPIFTSTLLGLAALAASGVGDANAQQVFKIVGPDGRVTFSDQPPPTPSGRSAPASTVPVPGGAAGANSAALPFELRTAASRYPVTLYSAPGCGPCDSGRTMLGSRGIPFSEKTITSNEDIEALKRLAGSASVPILTVGAQQLKGFSQGEWVQFLDAAGYPKSSQLPPGYAQAPATPLVAVQAPQTAARTPARETPAQAPAPVAVPVAEPANNPAGIKF
jgi:glutaredoxin